MFGFSDKENKERAVHFTVSNRTVVRILFIVAIFLASLAAVRQASTAIVLIFTAFFLSLALNSPVQWLSQRLPGANDKRRRTTATIISFVIVVALLGGFLASLVPPLVRQTNSFIQAAPGLVESVKSEDNEIGKVIRRYNLEDDINKFANQLSDRLDTIAGSAVSTAGRIGSSVFSVLAVLALTFMMLIEGPRWMRLFKDILPREHHPRAERLSGDMYRVVKGYVNGQVILAAIAAIMILPAMILLDISYPVALMVIVFICGLIPMVGHTIGAIIVTLVALFGSFWAALAILAYYILYQQIENYVVQPRVQANTTNMSPLLVFMSVVVGVNFGGLFGGLVAIPVAGCIRIAVLDYLHAKKIIDKSDHEVAKTEKYGAKSA